MSPSKSGQAVVASQSCAAGGSVTSAWFDLGIGVSGTVKMTNGGTGPATPCKARAEFSDDGTNVRGAAAIATATTGNGEVTEVPYGFGAGGQLGVGLKYRIVFDGNTSQAVTVYAYAESTAAMVP